MTRATRDKAVLRSPLTVFRLKSLLFIFLYFCCLITFCSFRAEHHHLPFYRLFAARVCPRALTLRTRGCTPGWDMFAFQAKNTSSFIPHPLLDGARASPSQ
jgi:hypothetical protein